MPAHIRTATLIGTPVMMPLGMGQTPLPHEK